jgi:hypothetical protein
MRPPFLIRKRKLDARIEQFSPRLGDLPTPSAWQKCRALAAGSSV